MQPTNSLVAVLRSSADAIESQSVKYDWYNNENCICGILAQTALQISSSDLHELMRTEFTKRILTHNIWTEMGKEQAARKAQKLSFSQVFAKLFELGLKGEDFDHLEHLSNPEVRNRAGIKENRAYLKPELAVSYLRTWATMLESNYAS